MKLYTRAGDDGETGLFAGPRVPKDHARVEAYGTVDELNAAIGLARSGGLPEDLEQILCRVQHELFGIGAELATPEPHKQPLPLIGDRQIADLEKAIDRYDAALPPLRYFILPAGTQASSALHAARGVCRRAERRVVTLQRTDSAASCEGPLRYLNRLGDLLFVLARTANARAQLGDVIWKRSPTANQEPARAANEGS